MSCRIVDYRSLHELKAYFPIDKAACEVTSNLKAAPAEEIMAIIQDAGENWLVNLHWGLVPSWAKDVSIGDRMINARAETVAEKPSFRDAFRNRRCLIPAAGFYEWRHKKDHRQPVFLSLPERRPFAFGGLWETWKNKNGEGSSYKSCTIITTQARGSFRAIHHRMPVILRPQAYRRWLDSRNQNASMLLDLLNNEIITELVDYPQSRRVDTKHPINPSRIKAVRKPQQTTIVWPEGKEPSPKK
jgi:putative SOS response-associated peptidase YedK